MLRKKVVDLIINFDAQPAPVKKAIQDLQDAFERFDKASAQIELWKAEQLEAEKEVQKIQKQADAFFARAEEPVEQPLEEITDGQ